MQKWYQGAKFFDQVWFFQSSLIVLIQTSSVKVVELEIVRLEAFLTIVSKYCTFSYFVILYV